VFSSGGAIGHTTIMNISDGGSPGVLNTGRSIHVGYISRVSMLSIGLLLPVVAVSDSGFISSIEGYYSAPARNCTERSDDGKLVPCDPPSTDCIAGAAPWNGTWVISALFSS